MAENNPPRPARACLSMARADAPFDTFEEMIAHAKAGNELSYSGQTPFDRLLIQYLNKAEGINIRHVPTRGGSEAIKTSSAGTPTCRSAGRSGCCGARLPHLPTTTPMATRALSLWCWTISGPATKTI